MTLRISRLAALINASYNPNVEWMKKSGYTIKEIAEALRRIGYDFDRAYQIIFGRLPNY